MVSTLTCVSRKMPRLMITAPMIGRILYRPVLLVTWPEISDVTVEPSISGISIRPLPVGEACCTVC